MMLYCFVQNYHWGKKGNESEVALLAAGNRSGYAIDKDKPYAELWMGTHRSGPSVVIDSGLLLIDWLTKNPAVLGYEVREKFGKLPFLFKVLSVQKALSIQAHPTKEHAQQLNLERPDDYPDTNHKPEMAIALTDFELLLGFRPIEEIRGFFKALPDLRHIMGDEIAHSFIASDGENLNTTFRACFRALMTAPADLIRGKVVGLVESLRTLDEPSRQSFHGQLVERLHSQYPGDVGVLGPYFFNYIVLKPGEAIFIPPNEPHSYLFGDCIECMACSDNVVRAGLTPKEKDVDTLCGMLTYICEYPSSKILSSIKEDQYSEIFKPPVNDFAVAKITIPKSTNYYMIVRRSASIAIVIRGKGSLNKKDFQKGSVFFMHAGQTNLISTTAPVLIFQAMANI